MRISVRRRLLVLTVFLIIISSTLFIWSRLDELDKFVFAVIVITIPMIIIGLLIQTYKGKTPVCLLFPAFMGFLILAFSWASGISLLIVLAGVIIGTVSGFSGTLIRWALKREKNKNDEGGIPQKEKK